MENSVSLQKQIDNLRADIKLLQAEMRALKGSPKAAPAAAPKDIKLSDMDVFLSDDLIERMQRRKLLLNTDNKT
jgi:hypothetical protein